MLAARSAVLARAAALGVALAPAPAAAQTLVIEAERVLSAHAGAPAGPAVIVVRDGRIVSVTPGRPAAGALPADALRIQAAVVMPGLIDARTTAGLSGLHPADDDTDDRGGPVRPELRAIDGFDLREPLLRHALRAGVTVVQAGPGDGNSIGGQAGIFRTHAATVAEATLRSPSAVVMSLTEAAKTTYADRNRLPTTRMANVALIRQALLDAGQVPRPDAAPDGGREVLARVLDGSLPALMVARRADELATALRVAHEFGFRPVVTGATAAPLLADRLAASNIVVLLEPPGPDGAAADRPADPSGAAAALARAGATFALATGDVRDGRSLLDWARDVVRHGLDPAAALAAVTLSPARILGLDDRVGAIAAGHDADLVLLDGDPFTAPARVRVVIVAGRIAHDDR